MRREKTNGAKRLTARERQEWVQAYQQSGMSRAVFARLHSLNYSTFCFWLKREAACSVGKVNARSWVELPAEVSAVATQPKTPYRFRLPGGLSLELDRGFDAQEVLALLSIAQQSCSH